MTTSEVVDDMIDQLENRDWGSAEVKRYFAHKIDAAIAAAVQAEREANAELAKSMIGATRHEIAAAIRARGNAAIDDWSDAQRMTEPPVVSDKFSRARNGAGRK